VNGRYLPPLFCARHRRRVRKSATRGNTAEKVSVL
jgi:hypothetical protein